MNVPDAIVFFVAGQAQAVSFIAFVLLIRRLNKK